MSVVNGWGTADLVCRRFVGLGLRGLASIELRLSVPFETVRVHDELHDRGEGAKRKD